MSLLSDTGKKQGVCLCVKCTHTHNTSLFTPSSQPNDSDNDERQKKESCQEIAQMLHKITSMLRENDIHHTWTLHLFSP